MNNGLDTADSDNLMKQTPAIFSSGINKHTPNRAATAGLGWVWCYSPVWQVPC